MSRIHKRCRICGNSNLIPILNLGNQALSSVFPDKISADPDASPLEMVLCDGPQGKDICRLLQLKHTANVSAMYGTTYGYRSSTSPSMLRHLQGKVDKLLEMVPLKPGDAILDIACNDGTLLNHYGLRRGLDRVGIDPSAEKFASNYQSDIRVIYDFFSAAAVKTLVGDKKFEIITSIAMLYDIDDPQDFIEQIADILSPKGVWGFEQSYTPTLMTNLTYDQVCHEHVTYLNLSLIDRMLKIAGLRVIDVSFNEINGGSFYVQACHFDAPHRSNTTHINKILAFEEGLNTAAPYMRYARRVETHRDELLKLVKQLKDAGNTIYGYGASTKGNITLNYCGLGVKDLEAICDAQKEKEGLFTPGSRIPIVTKETMRAAQPHYLLVLIWHFRSEIINEELDYLRRGGKMIFILPRIHIVDIENYQKYIDQPFSEIGYQI